MTTSFGGIVRGHFYLRITGLIFSDCQNAGDKRQLDIHSRKMIARIGIMAAHSEIWLRGNQRLLGVGLLTAALVLVICGLILYFFRDAITVTIISICTAGAIVMAALMFWVGRLPRIAYDSDRREVILYLPGPTPYRVPLDIVECFFLGSGITQIPGQPSRDVQTKNIVVRLAERAEDWHRRDLTLSIGKWCEGYITIRGLYCEPLDIEAVKRLNTLIHQAQQGAAKPIPSQPALVQGQLLTTGLETLQDPPQ